jgi:hypothetical protein
VFCALSCLPLAADPPLFPPCFPLSQTATAAVYQIDAVLVPASPRPPPPRATPPPRAPPPRPLQSFLSNPPNNSRTFATALTAAGMVSSVLAPTFRGAQRSAAGALTQLAALLLALALAPLPPGVHALHSSNPHPPPHPTPLLCPRPPPQGAPPQLET